MNNIYDPYELNEIVLERFEVGMMMHIAPALVKHMKINTELDTSLRMIEQSFITWALGNKIHTSSTKYYGIPLTWWDGFKQQYFPHWLKKRFPVKERELERTFNVTHVCPHIVTPDNEAHIRFMMPPEVTSFWAQIQNEKEKKSNT